MRFKKIIVKIHLWLGLTSGLLVVFLGVTGCLLAFEQEIRGLTESYQNVESQQLPLIPPSRLKTIAERSLHGTKINSLEYPGSGKAVIAGYYDADNYKLVYLDPYTGTVLKVKNMKEDFFRVVLDGHFYLWLPPTVGQPILASATLVFVIMMITGIVLWWPKNKVARKQRFSVKWNARWRRKNYDLHNVLGFYVSWVAIFIAITGLVMGFQWFAKSVYWISSGGKTMTDQVSPVSDTTRTGVVFSIPDSLWKKHAADVKENESLGISFAATGTDPIEIFINHRPGTFYNTDYYQYDQFTAKELTGTGSYTGKYKDATIADKLVRMNYDLHVGAALGLPGKLLAFFASLLVASLPVTGFIIWWGRRIKRRHTGT